MKKVQTWTGERLHLRLTADEINLYVNLRIWTTLRHRVPFLGYSRLLGGVEEPTSLHNFGMSIAYLLPAELVQFVHELGYDIVALGFSSAAQEGKRGKWLTKVVSRMTSLIHLT